MYFYRCRYTKSCGRGLNLIKPSMKLGFKFKVKAPPTHHPDVRSLYFRKTCCMSGISIHLLNYASTVHKAVQFKSKLQHTGILSAATWPHRRFCYRPTVFFYQLCLTALSFPREKIACAFKKYLDFLLFKKICTSEIA